MRLENIDLNVRQWGATDKSVRETLFLVHGLGANSHLWFKQIPVFAEHYHVIAIDLRGFGRSSKPQGRENYSIAIMAQDVIDVCAELGIEKINFCVVGRETKGKRWIWAAREMATFWNFEVKYQLHY